MALDEQLTGLSPTVCRRAIKAIRDADTRMGGEKRQEDLPVYCESLLTLLEDQINISSSFSSCPCSTKKPAARDYVLSALKQAELFLDVVEGKKTALTSGSK